MKGMVVLDNTDTNGVVLDATGEPLGEKPEAQEASEAFEGVEVEAKRDEPDPDDVEGEDGLTPRQKRDFTEAMKKTIGKKHRKAMEAEEFAQEQYNQRIMAERRQKELEERLSRYEQEAQPEETLAKPDRNQFQDDEAYQEAMIDYRVNLKLQKQAEEQYQQALEERREELARQAGERLQAARELVPDFQEVVGEVDTEVPPAIVSYMAESPMIAELGYYLAKNPKELESLSKKSPVQQLVDIGKIEAKLKPFEQSKANGSQPSQDGEPPSANGKPRKAPAPITPLNTASGKQVQKNESEMSYKEYREHWAQQHRPNLLKRNRH